MKKIYRDRTAHAQYDKDWKKVGTDKNSFAILNFYPIKYAEETLDQLPADGLILECGCGLGRVVMHYHNRGRRIVGLEYNEYTLLKIRKTYPDVPLVRADAMRLPFKDRSFDAVLAFGLYHSMENEVDRAIMETSRIIKSQGLICASSRIHNLMYYLYEVKHRIKQGRPNSPVFFKCAYKKKEWANLIAQSGFSILSVHPAFKVPVFYRLPFFQDIKCTDMTLSELQSYGHQLNKWGKVLEQGFRKLFDWWFCDRIVIIAQKKL